MKRLGWFLAGAGAVVGFLAARRLWRPMLVLGALGVGWLAFGR